MTLSTTFPLCNSKRLGRIIYLLLNVIRSIVVLLSVILINVVAPYLGRGIEFTSKIGVRLKVTALGQYSLFTTLHLLMNGPSKLEHFPLSFLSRLVECNTLAY